MEGSGLVPILKRGNPRLVKHDESLVNAALEHIREHARQDVPVARCQLLQHHVYVSLIVESDCTCIGIPDTSSHPSGADLALALPAASYQVVDNGPVWLSRVGCIHAGSMPHRWTPVRLAPGELGQSEEMVGGSGT